MKKHTHLRVSFETYNQYLTENKNNRLSKFVKIYPPSNFPPKYTNINEIFDTEYEDVKYEDFILPNDNPNYDNKMNYKYIFKSNKGNEYRLDLVYIKELDESKLKHEELKDKEFYSISYSLNNRNKDNYDDLTGEYEIYDLISRIKYLLNEFIKKYEIDEHNIIFMFGDPNVEYKLDMYKYLIIKCFKDYRIVVDYTSGFDNTNIGYYLLKF